MPRILLLLPTTTYRTHDFLKAAEGLGVEVVVASEKPSTMEALNPKTLVTLDFLDPEASADKVCRFAKESPFDAVIPVDEETAVVAAVIAEQLGLPFNSPEAARATRLKHLMRDKLARAGIPSPAHRVCQKSEDPIALAAALDYPVVLKPVFLSGSRGVIRANDPSEFLTAFHRLSAILNEPEVSRRGGPMAELILVEDYIGGKEVALEGLLTRGRLRELAVFDKPDPLEGPYFEETIYVAPSRLPESDQDAIRRATEMAAGALGLRHGPVHAELRLNTSGVYMIEIAGRSIGGLCSRTLRFGLGVSLEELILRHAVGSSYQELLRDSLAAGVMMIPIPRAGTLVEIEGLNAARQVADIEEITMTIHRGATLVPLPEGSTYLGFIFARAQTPRRVETALRQAHRQLRFLIED